MVRGEWWMDGRRDWRVSEKGRKGRGMVDQMEGRMERGGRGEGGRKEGGKEGTERGREGGQRRER